jgi:hypothetical protein
VGRNVDVDLLVGASDIVERLGLRRTQHVHWYYRHDSRFPEPIARIGAGSRQVLVWYWPDVEEWATGKWPVGKP